MSVQTGRPSMPPSSRGSLKVWARRLQDDPNPVWMRELRQSVRLQRTPIILAILAAMMALLICSIGGIASTEVEPARVGVVLFHTFFSFAFLVVTWLGPAVAASAIASERSGRTWEALLLTGVGTSTIAKGKFLSALTYLSLYVVMLAPVGALPFLFGGVTVTEVFSAFVLLFIFGALSVAFGLSLSSKFTNQAAAVIVTLIVSVTISIGLYVALGPLLSIAIHELWPAVPQGPPVWLPTAYERADFGLEYVAFLILSPLVFSVVPAWLFYETTCANLAGPSDDRSTGLRIWFLVSAPILTLTFGIAGVAQSSGAIEWYLCMISVFFGFLVFAVFLFAGEPLGPSRRVQVHWDRAQAGRLRRYFGPGIMQASSLLLGLGLSGIAVLSAAGGLWVHWRHASSTHITMIAVLSAYSGGFFVFLVGIAAWVRSRSISGAMPRLMLLAAIFAAGVGPWIAMAIAGELWSGSRQALPLAAPSPGFALVMIGAISSSTSDRDPIMTAGLLSITAWTLLGLLFLVLAGRGTAKRLKEYQGAIEQVEALFASEEAALASAQSLAEGASPATT